MNLIGRYYDIQKGEILIDGVNIKEMSKDQIRRAIGQVQQDVFVFTGDIKSNIRLRDASITRAQVVQAAETVMQAVLLKNYLKNMMSLFRREERHSLLVKDSCYLLQEHWHISLRF